MRRGTTKAEHSSAEKANTLPQSEKFKRAARELGADQSEEAFDQVLRKVARAPRAIPKAEEPVPSNRRARKIHTTERLNKVDEKQEQLGSKAPSRHLVRRRRLRETAPQLSGDFDANGQI